MPKTKKWTKKEIETHMRQNVTSYGGMVVCAALFKKLYGVIPSVGLSGFQGDGVELLQKVLPDNKEELK